MRLITVPTSWGLSRGLNEHVKYTAHFLALFSLINISKGWKTHELDTDRGIKLEFLGMCDIFLIFSL